MYETTTTTVIVMQQTCDECSSLLPLHNACTVPKILLLGLQEPQFIIIIVPHPLNFNANLNNN